MYQFTQNVLSSTTVLNFDNNQNCFWAQNQQIRIISEGLHETKWLLLFFAATFIFYIKKIIN